MPTKVKIIQRWNNDNRIYKGLSRVISYTMRYPQCQICSYVLNQLPIYPYDLGKRYYGMPYSAMNLNITHLYKVNKEL